MVNTTTIDGSDQGSRITRCLDQRPDSIRSSGRFVLGGEDRTLTEQHLSGHFGQRSDGGNVHAGTLPGTMVQLVLHGASMTEFTPAGTSAFLAAITHAPLGGGDGQSMIKKRRPGSASDDWALRESSQEEQ